VHRAKGKSFERELLWLRQHPVKLQSSLTAYYQAIIDLNTGAVSGFEALSARRSGWLATTAGAVIEEIEPGK
jgi:hypothetical protein